MGIVVIAGPVEKGLCSEHQQGTRVTVPSLADPEHPVLASRGVLSGCQSQIGGEFSTVAKRLAQV